MKMITKLAAVLLVAVMAFSLAACQKTPEKPGFNGEAKELIDAGIEKVKAANSYTFVMKITEEVTIDGVKQTDEMAYHCDVIEKGNGENTISIQWSSKATVDDLEYDHSMASYNFYFDGKTGYAIDGHYIPKRLTKYESDQAFTLAGIFADEEYMILDSNLVDVFCGFGPTVTKESDGSTTIAVEKLTWEQYGQIMAQLTDELEATDEGKDFFEASTVGAYFYLDADGCFRDFRITIENMPIGGGEAQSTGSNVMNFGVENVGKVNQIEVPEFVAKWNPESDNEDYSFGYCQMIGGIQFHYVLDSWGEKAWTFEEAGKYYWHDDIVECYIIPAEIAGLPVKRVTSTEDIRNIVIPSGVAFDVYRSYDIETQMDYWDCKDTTVFFVDSDDQVDVNFAVGIPGDEHTPEVKGVYYAGQWELVNGVPTPKN